MKIFSRVAVTALSIGILLPGAAWAEGEDPQSKEAVALLFQARQDVKVRRANELVWTAATPLTRLYNHDAVKTGAGASAIIQFNDQTKLNVDERSMVIVLDRSKGQVDVRESAVAVPSGTVHGRVSADLDRPLELVVRTSRGWIKATSKTDDPQGSRFRATVAPNGRMQVSSEGGDVRLTAQGRDRVIEPKETLTIAASPSSAGSADAAAYAEPPAIEDDGWVKDPPKKKLPPAPKKIKKPAKAAAPPPARHAAPAPVPALAPSPSPAPVPVVASSPEPPKGLTVEEVAPVLRKITGPGPSPSPSEAPDPSTLPAPKLLRPADDEDDE